MMLTAEQEVPPPDLAQLEGQLLIYAREVHALYQEEKKERAKLAEEKLVLEYRLKELTALNNLFQKHLARREQLEDILTSLVDGLRHARDQAQGNLRKQIETLLASAQAALAQRSPRP